MSILAKLRHLRIAPRKVRLVADLIRGKSIKESQNILNFIVKRAAGPLSNLLKSAVANAKNNFQIQEDNLYISKIIVDEGRKQKRWRPRARGQAAEIQKKSSHITIYLDKIKGEFEQNEKAGKPEKIKKTKKFSKIRKSKLGKEIGVKKPKIEKRAERVFRRKAF